MCEGSSSREMNVIYTINLKKLSIGGEVEENQDRRNELDKICKAFPEHG